MTDTPITDGGFEGDRSTRPARLAYDIDDGESPSGAVIRAVSAFTNTPPLDLDPLYDAVDPDHLDGVLAPADGGEDPVIAFAFNGCAVSVTPTEVVVQEAGTEGSREFGGPGD